MPPIVLVAVVAIAVAGRVADPARPAAPAAASAAARAGAAATDPDVRSSTPSPRSDWPAAVAGRGLALPVAREEGTDGLMGRLPFGLPNDTPYPRSEPVNRFVIDDVVAGWSSLDTTPPWVRRIGGLSSYVTDPYER